MVVPPPLENKDNQEPKLHLLICYKLIFAALASLLNGPEIIIFPDRAFYNI